MKDKSLISLINFIKEFFEGRDIVWIGVVGFITKNDSVIRIGYLNNVIGPKGVEVSIYNKITGGKNLYIFLFCDFLEFPENAKSINPVWVGFDHYWEVKPINKNEMVDKIFQFIDLYV